MTVFMGLSQKIKFALNENESCFVKSSFVYKSCRIDVLFRTTASGHKLTNKNYSIISSLVLSVVHPRRSHVNLDELLRKKIHVLSNSFKQSKF